MVLDYISDAHFYVEQESDSKRAFNANMDISKCSKTCIAIIIGLATMLLVAGKLTASFDLDLDCPIRICNKTNQLYHMRSKQCLQYGVSNGRICSSNMVIMPLTACRTEGECECDYENNERHLVYDDGTDQCYPIYSQGPCENGYVVTVSANGKRLNCKWDICFGEKSIISNTQRDSIVPFKNKCYTLSTELDEPGCKGKLKFWKNQLHPSCSPRPTHEALIAGRVPLRCEPGSQRAFLDRCTPPVRFTFGDPSNATADSEDDS